MRRIPRHASKLKPDDKLYGYEAITYEGTRVKGSTLGSSEEEVERDLMKRQYDVRDINLILRHDELIKHIERIPYFD